MRLKVSALVILSLLLTAPAGLAGCDPIIHEQSFKPAAVDASAPSAAPDPHSLYGRLQNSDRNMRIEAAVQAGRDKDAKAVPYLVDRLDDEYPEVRFAAILALEKITGTNRGYEYWASANRRDEAIARWRKWLQAGRPRGDGGVSP